MSQTGFYFTTESEVYYNEVEFNELVRSKVTSEPVYNDAGTTIKYIKHRVELEAIILPEEGEDTTDTSLANLRNKLLVSQKEFKYKNKGMGSEFSVLYSPSRFAPQDVVYGPKPTMLVFEPVGQGKAAHVLWTCEFHTVEELVTSLFPNLKGISELWTTTSYTVNKSGYKTVTTKGKMSFLSDTNGTSVRKTGESQFAPYLNALRSIADMPNYHKELDVQFSDDNQSCEFTITYTEIDASQPYPNGVVEIDFEHETETELMSDNPLKSGFKQWLNKVTCAIELRPNTHKARAWAIFTGLLNEKINKATTNRPLILRTVITNNQFKNTVSFYVEWAVLLGKSQVIDVFNQTGILNPFTGNNLSWSAWASEIGLFDHTVTGSNGLTTLGSVKDFIRPANQKIIKAGPKAPEPLPVYSGIAFYSSECPPEDQSWLDYRINFTYCTKVVK